MKLFTTLVSIVIALTFIAQEEENGPWFPHCIELNNKLHIYSTEVALEDWFAYVYDVNREEDNFDKVKSFMPLKQNEANAFLIDIFMRGWDLDENKEVWFKNTLTPYPLWLTKEEKKEKQKIKQYLASPVTGVTIKQVEGFLKWHQKQLADIYLEHYENYEISLQLPGRELMTKLHKESNRSNAEIDKPAEEKTVVGDSVNIEGCPFFNFKMDTECKGTEERIKEYGSNYGMVGIYSYFPDLNGLYNIQGNVSEMTNEPGISYGGKYSDYAKTVLHNPIFEYDIFHPEVGFRFVIKVSKKTDNQ